MKSRSKVKSFKDVSEVNSDSDTSKAKDRSSNDQDSAEIESEINSSESDSAASIPRVAQWQPDEENLETGLASDEPSPNDKQEGSSKLHVGSVKDDLASISFGTLLKARHVLDESESESNSDASDDSEDEESHSENLSSAVGHPGNSQNTLPKRGKTSGSIEKRTNKHAPTEMPSNRPVTRRRQVTDVKKSIARDPRFSPLSGDLSQVTFAKRYSFLSDLHKSELAELKDNLKRARTLLRSSPRDQREQREREVQRLELALKRSESAVNKDSREHIEREAMEKARREEREKRKGGKREWHLKSSEKKEMLLRARHDALAATGGRLAVKKAIEKRQKKINQKEKKRQPDFVSKPPRREDDPRHSLTAGSKRRYSTGDSNRAEKRQRNA